MVADGRLSLSFHLKADLQAGVLRQVRDHLPRGGFDGLLPFVGGEATLPGLDRMGEIDAAGAVDEGPQTVGTEGRRGVGRAASLAEAAKWLR